MTTNYLYKNTSAKFLEIYGPDSISFIQNLITNDINECEENHFLYSCLLTPQGKFFADFFIFKKNDKYVFEIHKKYFNNFIQKLLIYKLQSNIEIKEFNSMNSFIIFGDAHIQSKYEIFNSDPRNKNIGNKLIQQSNNIQFKNNMIEINEEKYHEILIKNKVPYSPYDLKENQSLLLENNFDNLNSISWSKGCYIGQEITARMKYRALLKKQLYSLKIISGKFEIGDDIVLKDKNLGKIITKVNEFILCMMKIDLVDEKSKNKEKIEIDDASVLEFL